MTDRPIIFSAPMVRALLEGRKTMTRRILKPQPNSEGLFEDLDDAMRALQWTRGDRLWVREAWRTEARYDETRPIDLLHPEIAKDMGQRVPLCSYEADYQQEPNDGCRGRLRPSIHMPRWASRLTLTVTAFKVERLQEISETDAQAEGMTFIDFGQYQPPGTMSIDSGRTFHTLRPRQHPGWHAGTATGPQDCLETASGAFANLWGRLHGDDAWAANPWVAAITFTVHKGNIDYMN